MGRGSTEEFKSKVQNFYLEKYLKIMMHFAAFMIVFFSVMLATAFFKCHCFWFWVLCCVISNYFFSGYNQDNQECYC